MSEPQEIFANSEDQEQHDHVRRTVAQMTLRSERKQRTYFESRKEYLDKFYPGRYSEGHMIPDVFKEHGTPEGVEAERKVFDMLQSLREEPMFSTHSYMGQSGEGDFLIVHKELGTILLEVKAPTTEKAYNQALKQAAKQFQHVKIVIQQSRLLKRNLHYPVGYAVIMPNADKGWDEGIEYRACFKTHLASKEAFLTWFKEMFPEGEILSQLPPKEKEDVYDRVASKLICPCVEYPIDDTHKKLIALTPQQANLLSGCWREKYINGPAGSGKTEILVLKVKEEKLKDQKKLVICYNKALSDHLRNRLVGVPKLKVMTVAQLVGEILDTASEPRRPMEYRVNFFWHTFNVDSQVNKKAVGEATRQLTAYPNQKFMFDSIFVDEGQDLQGAWEDLIEAVHVKGRNHYKWVFFDDNQKLNFSSPLRANEQNTYNLRYVIRNTVNIFKESRPYYLSCNRDECEIAHGITGEEVTWDTTFKEADLEGLSRSLLKAIDEYVDIIWQDLKDVCPDDICVLVESKTKRDRLKKELKEYSESIHAFTVDDKVKHSSPESKWPAGIIKSGKCGVTVDSIFRFKGLESKVVILLMPGNKKKLPEYMYTAITRCFCKLIIICSEETRKNACRLARDKVVQEKNSTLEEGCIPMDID